MSLKAFHVIFIAASVLLARGFAGWSFVSYAHDGPMLHLWLGIGSVLSAVGLLV